MSFSVAQTPDLSGKVALVTGGNVDLPKWLFTIS